MWRACRDKVRGKGVMILDPAGMEPTVCDGTLAVIFPVKSDTLHCTSHRKRLNHAELVPSTALLFSVS